MIDKKSSLISDWLIFIKVVECQSFSKAARELHRSVSTVSKSVAKLEETLCCQLIIRSAHKFEITASGLTTYEKAKAFSLSYYDLMAELSLPDNKIQGSLRLSAPGVLCDTIIPRWIMSYTARNPEAVISLQSREGGSFSANSPEFDDLVIKSGYIDSPYLVHKKINPVPFGIYASPGYLAEIPEIRTPEDLEGKNILRLQHPSLAGSLTFNRLDTSVVMDPDSHTVFSSNSVSSLINLATEGRGICLAVPTWAVRTHLQKGSLRTVLPDWRLPALPSYLVWRYRRNYSRLFKDFIPFLENQWDELFSYQNDAAMTDQR